MKMREELHVALLSPDVVVLITFEKAMPPIGVSKRIRLPKTCDMPQIRSKHRSTIKQEPTTTATLTNNANEPNEGLAKSQETEQRPKESFDKKNRNPTSQDWDAFEGSQNIFT